MTDQFHYTDGQGHRLTLDAVVGAAGTPFVRVTAEDTAIGGSIASVWLKLDQAAALARHLSAGIACELTDHTGDTLTVTVGGDFTTFTVTPVDSEDDDRASVPVVALTGRLPAIRRALKAATEEQQPVPSDAELIEHARTVGMVEPEKAPAFLAAFRAHVEEQSAGIGTRPVPQPAEERYPCGLGVFCDTCDIEFRGDFIVTDTMTKAQRLDVVRSHVRAEGWQCDAAGDFCPECEPSAPTAEQATANAATVGITTQQAARRAILDSLGTLAHVAIWPHPATDIPENTDAATIEVSHAGMDRRAAAYAFHQVADRLTALADADGHAPLDADAVAAADKQNEHLDAGVPGDLFTEAAASRTALLAGITAIEALPQDYECDPGRGDAVKVLRRLTDHYATNEQPAGLTWEARTEHAVRLYATTAIERDDALADAARALAQRNAVFTTNEQLLAQVEEAGQARIQAENEARTLHHRHTAVRAIHTKHTDSEHCRHDAESWPCPTVAALGDDVEEQPAMPAVGDRYTSPDGTVVTVNRVWNADDGHTSVAYEWHDPRASYAGSACPLDVFRRTYRAEAGR